MQAKRRTGGVMAAKQKGCMVVTLSGFDNGNPLMKLGDINIHVPIPRPHYGLVEVSHYVILNYILDFIVNKSPA